MDYYNEDYLMHYGIKGMKWGVRRYQNEDGSLTPKGQKRLAKMEKYREKLAGYAKSRAHDHRIRAKEAEANSADLQKRGRYSDTYKKWQKDEHEKRAKEFERTHQITGPDGKRYVQKYDDTLGSFFDDLHDNAMADSKVQDLIDENNKTARRSRESAKSWTKANKNLMSMEVTALTKKKDIRKVYWS